jgi:hypothetical protein
MGTRTLRRLTAMLRSVLRTILVMKAPVLLPVRVRRRSPNRPRG